MRIPLLSGWAIGVAVLGPAAAVSGQGIGSAAIFGEVADATGRPVVSAQVEVRHVPTGVLARTITNGEGRYQLVNLRPGGPYELTVTSFGYAEARRTNIHLRAEQRLRLDFTVSEEAIEMDPLEVVARRDPRFDVSRTGPDLTLTRQVIRAHPTIERNLIELAALSPMAVKTTEEGGYSISGQNERHNAILIDGALNQDIFGSSSSGMPGAKARAKPIPMAAIQEFRVEVAPFDARSSGFTGGVLNAITRSGTNEWRSSAFSQFRNERFFGDLLLEGTNVAPERYQKSIYGFNLGGPIRRDQAHVFVAAEIERRTEPAPGLSHGVHEPVRTKIAADSIARLAELLADYGVAAGTPRQVSLDNPLTNLFTRLDWRLGDAHTLTLRHNYAGAARDSTPNRAPFGAYELSSATYRAESSSHSFNAKLLSRFGAGHSNELSLNVHRMTDRSIPASEFSQVDVRIQSAFDDLGLTRTARAGSPYFSQRESLQQTVVQISDALMFARDDIVTAVGLSLDAFRFEHDMLPGSRGYYRFPNLLGLEENRPIHYEITGFLPGADDGPVRFWVLQPAAFVQNEHRFPGNLVLRYGLRLDVPVFPTEPQYNPAVEEAFGLRTDRLPSGKLKFSPRFGFNWQSEHRHRTQVRGGFGMFTGRIPFVWMANAYQYTGLRRALLACVGEAAPPWTPSGPPPVACADGSGLEDGVRQVVAFDPDFRYPRELKLSAAIDQELPGGFVVGVEGLGVMASGRTFLRELNTVEVSQPVDLYYDVNFGSRHVYGDPIPDGGYRTRRKWDDFAHVLEMTNQKTSTSFAYALTTTLEKRFGDWLHVSGSITRSRSEDRQSLVHPDMFANYGSSPTDLSQDEPPLTPSNFDRPWKHVLNVRLRLPDHLGGGELSTVYVGQAGAPYSYVYGDDINGDGYAGTGVPLDVSNDLLGVPSNPIRLNGSIASRLLFREFVEEVEPCLADTKGYIMWRNSCRAPDTHRLDLRVVQPFHVGGLRVEVTGDLLNALNLIDPERGRIWEVDAVVPLLDVAGRHEGGLGGLPGPVQLGYGGSVRRDPETGQVSPELPYSLITPASQWQAQLGVRVSFPGASSR